MRGAALRILLATLLASVTYRCTQCQKPKKAPATSTVEQPESPVDIALELTERGRKVYSAQCIACHARNPAQDGSLGPSVLGSSRELLEARIVYGKYPEGYTPKKKTGVMPVLPHLKNEIDALHAYLNPK